MLVYGVIVRDKDVLLLGDIGHYVPREVEKLWKKMKETDVQKASCNADQRMTDDEFVSDKDYYPFRVTFENKKYEMLFAEGIMSSSCVNYDLSKNVATTGEKYDF